MDMEELLQQALGRLRQRFSSGFAEITLLPDRDWDDEDGWIELLEDFIARCKSDLLHSLIAVDSPGDHHMITTDNPGELLPRTKPA